MAPKLLRVFEVGNGFSSQALKITFQCNKPSMAAVAKSAHERGRSFVGDVYFLSGCFDDLSVFGVFSFSKMRLSIRLFVLSCLG